MSTKLNLNEVKTSPNNPKKRRQKLNNIIEQSAEMSCNRNRACCAVTRLTIFEPTL